MVQLLQKDNNKTVATTETSVKASVSEIFNEQREIEEKKRQHYTFQYT